MKQRKWRVVGLMSGTSMDGLDIALCEFDTVEEEVIKYAILKAITVPYSQREKEMLALMESSAVTLAEADHAFGRFCGIKVKEFLESNQLKADFVASHGHTIFHQPPKKFTTQIGNGAALSAMTGLPVVSDFRSMDVALDGQGAPLVPVGDLLLFEEFDFCLNLGGIANISQKSQEGIVAFDVCPANMVLNYLASKKGLEYDRDGALARSGKVDLVLLEKLEGLGFYREPHPKSLGKEWVDTNFIPLLEATSLVLEDILATVTQHVAQRIAKEIMRTEKQGKLLVTGGGAFNGFLMEKLKSMLEPECRVFIPEPQLIAYKEALVFAFLGLLRIWNKPNSLKTVTGALQDAVGGALYGDFRMLIA